MYKLLVVFMSLFLFSTEASSETTKPVVLNLDELVELYGSLDCERIYIIIHTSQINLNRTFKDVLDCKDQVIQSGEKMGDVICFLLEQQYYFWKYHHAAGTTALVNVCLEPNNTVPDMKKDQKNKIKI